MFLVHLYFYNLQSLLSIHAQFQRNQQSENGACQHLFNVVVIGPTWIPAQKLKLCAEPSILQRENLPLMHEISFHGDRIKATIL